MKTVGDGVALLQALMAVNGEDESIVAELLASMANLNHRSSLNESEINVLHNHT